MGQGCSRGVGVVVSQAREFNYGKRRGLYCYLLVATRNRRGHKKVRLRQETLRSHRIRVHKPRLRDYIHKIDQIITILQDRTSGRRLIYIIMEIEEAQRKARKKARKEERRVKLDGILRRVGLPTFGAYSRNNHST